MNPLKTPLQKVEHKEFVRKRLKWATYALYLLAFSSVPLYQRYFGTEEAVL